MGETQESVVHTPGPWKVFDREDSDWTIDDVMTDAKPHRRICNVHGSTAYPENRANAKLIAAAPEMLAAIQGALRIENLWRPSEDTPEEHWEEAKALYMMLSQFEDVVHKVV